MALCPHILAMSGSLRIQFWIVLRAVQESTSQSVLSMTLVAFVCSIMSVCWEWRPAKAFRVGGCFTCVIKFKFVQPLFTVWYTTNESACKNSQSNQPMKRCDQRCTKDIDPVCATDGYNFKIFGNWCLFTRDNCLDDGSK